MAGSLKYTAVLDACVLYPFSTRDIFLSLAQVGIVDLSDLAAAAQGVAKIVLESVQKMLVNI